MPGCLCNNSASAPAPPCASRIPMASEPNPAAAPLPTRERLLYALYEAAELEHTLMCTYLYAAFSLRSGEAEGLSAAEAEAVARWRRSIIDVADRKSTRLNSSHPS